MDEALRGLTRRQLEDLREKIERELRSCMLCGNEGAETYRVSSHGTVASLLLCKPCFEKHRLPEGRSAT